MRKFRYAAWLLWLTEKALDTESLSLKDVDPILQDSHWYFQVLVAGTKNWARDTRRGVTTDSLLRRRKAFLSRAVGLWVGTGLRAMSSNRLFVQLPSYSQPRNLTCTFSV